MMNENSKNTVLSQNPRNNMTKDNMTKEEKRLWNDFLKYLPQTVHRQKVIGNYIADFYCEEANVVIEIDDPLRREGKEIEKDGIKDRFFKRQKITVLRYSNNDVRQKFDEVCMDIMQHVESAESF